MYRPQWAYFVVPVTQPVKVEILRQDSKQPRQDHRCITKQSKTEVIDYQAITEHFQVTEQPQHHMTGVGIKNNVRPVYFLPPGELQHACFD